MKTAPSVFNSLKLKGHRALVTGSSQGIGRAIALALAEAGAAVAIHYAGSEERARESAAACSVHGQPTAVVRGDLTDPSAPAAIYADVYEALGAPDILVLNAAVQFRRPWNEIPPTEARAQIQANFLASLELIRLCQPAMAAAHWGRVLTIGSVQQVMPSPEMAVYAAMKAAQANLVQNLAKIFGPDGITVNNLRVGLVTTARNERVLADENRRAEWLARIPVGFLGEPADCAAAALLLCSDAGRYITGADIPVDGGLPL